MFVYLAGDPVKGVVASHTLVVNPGGHLGTGKVPAAWCEKDDEGRLVGKTFHISFINGRADVDPDLLGQYLIDHGFAQAQPWHSPPDVPCLAEDPGWRWRA